jgi:tetratricopeptide (TPR) repeat protein
VNARESYLKTLDHEEPTPDTYCCLGATYERTGQFELAISYYQKSIKLDQLWDEGWYGVGVCLDAQEKWFEAIHFLRKAIQLNPENYEYWLAVAQAEAQIGNVVSSLEAYEKASELEPHCPDIWMNWSLLLYDQGDYLKAADLALEGIEETPENADLHYYAAAYLINAGRYKEAFQYLENALILDFEKHTMLFEFFPQLETQKALYKIIDQYRKK